MNPRDGVTWLHPSRRPYRFVILIVVCFVIYGSYFAYDSVGAIEDFLMDSMRIGQEDIGLMYSMYSWGAIFTLLAAGWLIDRIGTRRSSMLFAATVTVGAVIVAWASSVRTIHIGRFVFGAGSEALIVAQSAILARWFKGKELALAFGVSLTICRLGTMFSFNTEALIAERMGPSAALWVAAGLCAVSVIANFIYFLMDRWAEPVLALDEKTAGDRIVWGDILKFRASYWYIALLCLCFYSAIFPFTALSTNFFHEKWGLPLAMGSAEGFFAAVFQNFRYMFSTAPGTTSILVAMSMVFAPFAGALVDRIGRRASMMIFGSALMIPCYLALAYTHLSPAMVMVVLGMAFVLVPAALWPAVPLIVSRGRLGTAFGVMTLIQNVGLMLFPWLNGWLRERTETYSASMLMFAGLGVAALVFAVLLRSVDRRDRILEAP
ncbi:MAG: MFS transporter [Candidatus Eisenbacteria bacterium]